MKKAFQRGKRALTDQEKKKLKQHQHALLLQMLQEFRRPVGVGGAAYVYKKRRKKTA